MGGGRGREREGGREGKGGGLRERVEVEGEGEGAEGFISFVSVISSLHWEAVTHDSPYYYTTLRYIYMDNKAMPMWQRQLVGCVFVYS